MTTNTGGPAYPTSNYNAIAPMSTGYSEGMTLRDYFAAKAMQEIISSDGDFLDARYSSPETIANAAYHMADAMLKARKIK